ncbi:hypothetical protein HAX54_003594 [Datura stramonium]|uniref:peroxidase n=1 Tax=Datura stramonium TaxID=4076 RepID=A0ABS8T6V1_DATST|nr:hypothetical protein [Datura stramonium]
MSGGPYWNVLKGRKDGRVSRANETINLPAPSFNTSQLIQSFANRGLGRFLDPTSSVLDNNYYKQIISGKGVFASDQSLLNDYRTGLIVKAFANDQTVFFREFAASMIRLGNVGVLEEGEVRLNCRAVN